MYSFEDTAGRVWLIEITVGTFEDAKASGVDLEAALATESGLADLLFTKRMLIGRLLWVLCQKQAGAQGVGRNEFNHSLNGSAIEAATVALLKSLADFTQLSKVAAAVKDHLPGILDAAQTLAIQQIDQRMGKLGSSSSPMN